MDFADLAFFTCVCRGVKFYDAGVGGLLLPLLTRLAFKHDSFNLYYPKAVLVSVVGSEGTLICLGHVDKEAVRWLSPLLLCPYTVSG